MEEINEEKIEQEINNIVESTQEEVETVADAVAETVTETAEEASEEAPVKKSNKKLWILLGSILGVLVIAAIVMACLGLFSKYPGFKKDRQTGLYYKFYAQNDTAAMPKTGDFVGLLFSLRAGDSLLIPMTPQQMMMDSLYEDDIYAALRMMHVGDSATFILNGKYFFQNFFNMDYPFGDDPLYVDMKLFGHIPHDEFMKMQAEYAQKMQEKEANEATLIAEYVKENNITVKPDAEGMYFISTKKGTGAPLQPMQTVRMGYVGKFLDGTVFDQSTPERPFSFVLGAGQVIPGWDKAISNMRVGDKATIILPSSLAYGERGNYGIEPYTPLVFDIEVLGVEEAAAAPTMAPAE